MNEKTGEVLKRDVMYLSFSHLNDYLDKLMDSFQTPDSTEWDCDNNDYEEATANDRFTEWVDNTLGIQSVVAHSLSGFEEVMYIETWFNVNIAGIFGVAELRLFEGGSMQLHFKGLVGHRNDDLDLFENLNELFA